MRALGRAKLECEIDGIRSSASEREHEQLSVAAKLETDGAIAVIWGHRPRDTSRISRMRR